MARKVLDDVKPEKLVLAHMGGNEMWDDVERYLVGQNVYFDTGVILNTMPQEQFLRIVHMHGADRILFGTDSPWADQKNFVALLEHMPLTEEEKAAIFSEKCKEIAGNIADRSKKRRLQNIDDTKNVKNKNIPDTTCILEKRMTIIF